MPTGVLTDNLMVLMGGLIGGALGKRLSERIKICMNQVFGFVAIGIAITLVAKAVDLGAVVLSVILGTCIGSALKLEKHIESFFARTNERILREKKPDDNYMAQFTTLLVLCCCSGTGVFGAMNEALTGDSTTILCKAILDFFTVLIFATTLGKFTAIIAIPQMVILLTLFFCARLVMPLMTASLTGNFSAVGGIIELIIGFRILRLTKMPAIDALPALIIVFPVTVLWKMLL